MNSDLQERKELLSPPGDTIQETIDFIGMSQVELAERIGRPKEKLNDIIKGREPISMNTALLLERVLGIPASFWMERENEFREELARIGQEEALLQQIDWLKHFPINDLKKLGWLPKLKDKSQQLEALLKFYGVAHPKQWESIYVADKYSVAFRVSLANIQNPYSISAWLRIGEKTFRDLDLPDFNLKEFKETLNEVKVLVQEQPKNFKEQLQVACLRCGVAVVYTPCLNKAPISGATRWINNKPLIQLSGRYKTNDQFWFSFYHEAGHIIKHGKKEIFLENLKGSELDQKKEKEANEFAQKYLFPVKAMDELLQYPNFDDELIIDFAQKYKTHPAIIIGQLQHNGVIKYFQRNNLKEKISIF